MSTASFQSLKFLIVDDEQIAREILETFVGQLPNSECVACCANASEALAVLQEVSVDIVLLDIEMPQLKGTALAAILQGKVSVIFTTAYPQYALDAFSLEAVDYLMKPISFQRFVKAVEKVRKQQNRQTSEASTPEAASKEIILLKSEGKHLPLRISEISYIEGNGDYVHLHSRIWGELICRDRLQRLEEILPSDTFLRIHRSFIIHLKEVSSFTKDEVVVLEKTLPVGRSYKKITESTLFKFFTAS